MKRLIVAVLIVILCLSFACASAERKTVVKDKFYLGAMRVVRCKEYVTLRETPDKKSAALAKVPLDAIVLYCSNDIYHYARATYRKQAELFIRCEYEGQEGYILKKYLQKAPEFEPGETKAFNNIMSRDEIIGSGETVLQWQEFNVSVLAAYEVIEEDGSPWEYLRVGCFIDEEPIWGYTEAVKQEGQYRSLKAFMGGTEDEPQVYVYDAQYGLIMIDLMDGVESWTLRKNECSLGDASVCVIGENTGIMYIAGTDGPDPIAISSEGTVLWRADIDDPEVYGPAEIRLNSNAIEVIYESGKMVTLEYNGDLISITDI